jgi:hypothetical protein
MLLLMNNLTGLNVWLLNIVVARQVDDRGRDDVLIIEISTIE